MILEELEDLIVEINHWHKIRGGLNKKRARDDRKPMVMETLPWVLKALYDYRAVLYVNDNRNRAAEKILESAG